MTKITFVLFSFPFSVPAHLLGSAAGDTFPHHCLFTRNITGCLHWVTNSWSLSQSYHHEENPRTLHYSCRNSQCKNNMWLNLWTLEIYYLALSCTTAYLYYPNHACLNLVYSKQTAGANGYELQKCSSCGLWFSPSLDGSSPSCLYLETLWWSASNE